MSTQGPLIVNWLLWKYEWQLSVSVGDNKMAVSSLISAPLTRKLASVYSVEIGHNLHPVGTDVITINHSNFYLQVYSMLICN